VEGNSLNWLIVKGIDADADAVRISVVMLDSTIFFFFRHIDSLKFKILKFKKKIIKHYALNCIYKSVLEKFLNILNSSCYHNIMI